MDVRIGRDAKGIFPVSQRIKMLLLEADKFVDERFLAKLNEAFDKGGTITINVPGEEPFTVEWRKIT